MATASIFSSLRRRRSPSPEAFLAPVDLTDIALVHTLAALSSELICLYSGTGFPFQSKNSRSLIRKLEVFGVLLEFLLDSGSRLPSTAILCFKELYLILYRSKMLLDYCSQSSRIWLVLQNHSISGHFHDLNQEISTLLDIFPLNDIELGDDIREQIELLRRQSRKAKLFVDEHDEALRLKIFCLLDKLEKEQIPNKEDLNALFVDGLGLQDPKSCRTEIDFLEEQISNHEGDLEPAASVLNGFVALTRFCRFFLFGFEEDEVVEVCFSSQRRMRKALITQEIADTFITIPRDFCCPISFDLMRDPVIISTGQTYDRDSITRWMEEGHCTCPQTGQLLIHTRLVPNRALRNLIMQWCMARGMPFDPSECPDASSEAFAAASPTKAEIIANRATALLLIDQLAGGSQVAQGVAAREIRLLAKTGKENRAYIAQAGAIPYLKGLLSSPMSVAQENSVTAMLNLSIYDKNRSKIMDEEGCLKSIVKVLRFGLTAEARENAAATLFSLSAVHEYKRKIADEEGAIEALTGLLKRGTARGQKDAVAALFNLSTHTANCPRIVDAGAVTSLVGALGVEGVAVEAAGALASIVRQSIGAEAVGKEEMAVTGLIGMMRCGTPRGKENAVAALLELCRSGGPAAAEKVLKAPALSSLLQSLVFTGTRRARRKAASLVRVFQRCEQAVMHYGGLGVGYAIAGNSTANRDSSFTADVSIPMSMSLPVL